MNEFRVCHLVSICAVAFCLGAGPALAEDPPPFLLEWGTSGSGPGEFDRPMGIATDGAGNVYVGDLGNHRIQKFTAGGTFLTEWGGAGTGDGQFQYVAGLAIDADDNVYVTDYQLNRVQKFSSAGAFLSKWGTQGALDGQFDHPLGIAVGEDGSVYVVDALNYRVQKFTSNGAFLGKWGSASEFGEPGTFNTPGWVAVGPGDVVYVTDNSARAIPIQKFSSAGAYLTGWASRSPNGVAVDSTGDVYVSGGFYCTVAKYTENGAPLLTWGTCGSGNGQFNLAGQIAIGPGDEIYVVSYYDNDVQKFGSALTPVTRTTWGRLKAGYR